MPSGAGRGGLRPVMTAPDVLLQLWRAKGLMLLVFLPVVLAAVIFAMMMPVKYNASTRLLVRLGPEYVFDPVVGDAARGAFPQQENVLQAEAELAHSPVIVERVIRRVGLERLYPEIARAARRAGRDRVYALEQRALEAFARDFTAGAAPKSSIMRMTFAHTDAGVAAGTLNAFVDVYMEYRREVLGGEGVNGLRDQRDVVEGRLKAADDAVQSFLTRSGLSDFNAEAEAVARLYGDASGQIAAVEATLTEADARVAGLRRQMGETPRDIDLYVETTVEQELYGLKLEREKLLTRYRADSQAVQDVERRIGQIEQFVRSGPAGGLKRIGPNPTWQTLDAELAGAQASAAALRARLAELNRQKSDAEIRRNRLAAIEPEYRRMVRERDALESSAQTFATREQAERVRSELAERNLNTISVYEAARPPAKGQSPRRLIALAGAALGLLTALAVGLLRAWGVRGLSGAAIAERSLGLPVLASANERSAT